MSRKKPRTFRPAVEVLEAAKNSDHWKSKLEGKNRGRGIAAGYWFNAGLKSAVSASVNADGTRTNIARGPQCVRASSTALFSAVTLPKPSRCRNAVASGSFGGSTMTSCDAANAAAAK